MSLPPLFEGQPSGKTGAAMNRGGSKQDYGTPPEFIRAVEERFGPIAFDLAASAENTVAPAYFDEEADSLKQDWWKLEGNLWLNPPFAHIEPWAAKCEEVRHRQGWLFFLTPASVGCNWFERHLHRKAYVIGVSPRLTFVGESHGYPKDLSISLFGFGVSGFDTWRWQ